MKYEIRKTALDLSVAGVRSVELLTGCISGCTPSNEKAVRVLAETFSPIHTHIMTGEQYISLISEDR